MESDPSPTPAPSIYFQQFFSDYLCSTVYDFFNFLYRHWSAWVEGYFIVQYLSYRFEVCLLGKLQITGDNHSPTSIDDAVNKYNSLLEQHNASKDVLQVSKWLSFPYSNMFIVYAYSAYITLRIRQRNNSV